MSLARGFAIAFLAALPSLALAYPARFFGENSVPGESTIADTILALQHRVSGKVLKVDRLPREQDFYYECQRLPNVPPTLLCLFNHRLLMNAALSRPTYYLEQEKRILSKEEFLEEVKSSRAEGFNLPLPKVRGFYQQARENVPPTQGAASTPEEVFLRVEERFSREVLKEAALEDGHNYLITAAVTEDLLPTLSHELLHAQYFHDAQYRTIVQAFWRKEVSPAEKQLFRSVLQGSYDVQDEALLMDEFQAYLLMYGSTLEALDPLKNRHQGVLLSHLRASGRLLWADEIPGITAVN
jgi:hypothetical protein